MVEKFIETHPGTIFSTNEELTKEILDHILKETGCYPKGNNEDYNKFFKAYITDALPLNEIPAHTGLDTSTCSTWAAYLFWTIEFQFMKMKSA